MAKFRATLERGNPPMGEFKCVVSMKGPMGGRWEFAGKVPLSAGHSLMAIAITQGRSDSLNNGFDLGIEAAFANTKGS